MKQLQYGIDAPNVVITILITGCLMIAGGTFVNHYYLHRYVALSICFAFLVIGSGWGLTYMGLFMMYSSYVSKKRLASAMIEKLAIMGDERILDLGCGSGLFLIEAAKKLTTGKAIGLDIWQTKDQSQNTPDKTVANIEVENVSEQVCLTQSYMQRLPFKSGTFDIIISNLAIHNIPDEAERNQVLQEIVRVMKPNGKVIISDFMNTKQYWAQLNQLLPGKVALSSSFFSVFPPVRWVTID